MATNGDQQGHPEQIDRRRLFLGLGRRLLFFVLCFFYLPDRGGGQGAGC